MQIGGRLALTVTLLALSPSAFFHPLQAQNYAEITGNISDPTSAIVGGATVAAINVATGQSREAVTNASGNYTIPFLVPGIYDLTVGHEGFKAASREGVELQLGDVARVDFELEVGTVTEVVEVTGAPPMLNSENAVVGTVIENRRIVELPLNGRNYLQMIALTSNVTAEMSPQTEGSARKGGERAQQVFSIAGQRNAFNRYTLDGIENTEHSYGLFAIRPSIDALQEFNVQTGVYSAEYGRNPSQVIVATKSGTNQFHGTVFQFHRNENVDAKEWLLTGDRNPFVRNQFGFTVGGPIVRERVFFMANYEGLRERKALERRANVATDRMRAGDLSASGRTIFDPLTRTYSTDAQGNERAVSAEMFPNLMVPQSRFHPTTQKLLEFYPRATVPGDRILRNFTRDAKQEVDWDQFTQRVDFIESDSSSWFGRFSWSDEFFGQIATFQHQEQDVITTPMQAMLQNTRTFGSAIVNEFRFGYTLFQNDQVRFFSNERDVITELGIVGLVSPPPLAWGVPSTGLGLGLSGFGEQVNGPFVQNSHVFQWVDNVSVVRGKHSLKFGGEFRRDRFNEAGVPFQRGSFAFRGVTSEDPTNRGRTGHPMADLLLGKPNRSQRSRVPANGLLRGSAVAAYFEDTWRVTDRLSINLGLRYEYTPPYHDRYRGAMNVLLYDPGVTDDVRVDPNSRVPLMVRAGAGDFHEGLPYHWHDGIPKASSEEAGLPKSLVENDRNDFAPRIGIAWRPGEKTTIRTGFGVFYIQDIAEIHYDLARNIGGRSDFIADRERHDADLADPWRVERERFVCSNWAGDCQGPTFTLAVNTKRRTPYSLQWMFNVQRQLDDATTLEVGYLGTGGHKLERLVLWNQAVHRAGPDDFSSVVDRRPWGDEYGLIQTSNGVVSSSYNAGNLKLRRRFSGGLTYLVGYTWSKSMDNGSGIRVRGGEEEQAAFLYDLRAERALSQFHTGHRWVTSFLWDIPGVNRQGALTKIINGWQIGSILTFSTGTPINVSRIGDRNNTGTGTRPDATGIAPHPENPTADRFWNIDAFSDASRELLVREGTSGRNVLRRPGVAQWDFSLTKNTTITEGQTLQFRFEAFNFANHPNWNPPGRNIRAPATFGVVTSARTMRELQFGLKYIF